MSSAAALLLPSNHQLPLCSMVKQVIRRTTTTTAVPVASLRPGHYINVKGELCVVAELRRISFARASTYVMLDYHPYGDPTKISKVRMTIEETAERVEPDRIDGVFSYIDPETKRFVIQDSEFNEVDVPLSLFPIGVENAIRPGEPVTVYRYENTWLSYSFKLNVQSKLKKAQGKLLHDK